MVDKDNSSSVVFLLLNSTFKADIVLIGREAFNLQYKGRYSSLSIIKLFIYSDVIKPTDISDTHKNIELDMSKTTSITGQHLKMTIMNWIIIYISVNHYIIMRGFMMCK